MEHDDFIEDDYSYCIVARDKKTGSPVKLIMTMIRSSNAVSMIDTLARTNPEFNYTLSKLVDVPLTHKISLNSTKIDTEIQL